MKFDFRPRFALMAGAFALLPLSTGISSGDTIIFLPAIQDTVVTHNTTLNDTPLNNQQLDVRGGSNTANTSTTKRYSVIEFDLSSVNAQIIGAELRLYMPSSVTAEENNGTTTTSAVAYALTSSINEATLTWTILNSRADMGLDEVPLTDLGAFTFSGAVPTNQYYSGKPALQSEWEFLEARRTASFPHVGFLLNPNSTLSVQWHRWADHESGFAPQLVLTVVPEPSAVILTAFGVACCAFGLRRKLCK